ncbi:hypothetical protein LCGC14_0943420 [marine sediment metagenome]|uniref:Glycosyl transferase CAP10 domain-containing protein n=1 Tax=marine sediment metagenome TaxID=412755 RepID=A0A0F9NP42_9ZZZZ
MKRIKIMFVSWHFPTPELLLDIYKRLTPNCAGIWKNIEATLNPDEADYFIVIGGYKGKFDSKRALYFGQHGITSPNFKDFKNVECLASFPLDKHLNPGELWIDYTYDELINLQPSKKNKDLCCITTYQTHRKYYTDRIRFMQNFMPRYTNCDLFGKPSEKFKTDSILKNYYKKFLGRDDHKKVIGTYISGKNILVNYRYSLEFDQGWTVNCINERFYDAMLLWTMPIYFGAKNVEEFYPINSFRYVDISKNDLHEEINKVITLVNSNFREEHIEDIREARELILNRYLTFPYIHYIINNLDKYIKK